MWHTFDIFTHVFTRVVVLNLLIQFIKIQFDDLVDGYNVIITTNKKMYSNNR